MSGGGESSDSENETIETSCPCKRRVKCMMIRCSPCNRWFHTFCVGLKGLTKAMLLKLVSWSCPFCLDVVKSSFTRATISDVNIQKIADKIETVIDKKIEDKTKAMVAEMTVNTRQIVVNSQTTAVKAAIDSSREKMDLDHHEREKRKSNIVVKEVEESTSRDPTERKDHDQKFLVDVVGIDSADIINVFRAGAPKSDGSCRPLIATISTPDLAAQIHNYGRGRRVNWRDRYWWVNQDLIQADRLANYNARVTRRQPRQYPRNYLTVDSISPISYATAATSRRSARTRGASPGVQDAPRGSHPHYTRGVSPGLQETPRGSQTHPTRGVSPGVQDTLRGSQPHNPLPASSSQHSRSRIRSPSPDNIRMGSFLHMDRQ